MDEQIDPRRRLRHRLRPHRRPPGLCLRAGLHGLRRIALRNQRAEDLQDHGPGAEDRRAGDRAERFRRRAHSGRRGLARRLCRYLPAQHAGQRRGAADLRHHGAVRRRRGLLARHHRFRLHGGPHQLHVRHRSGRDQDRDPRRRHQGKAGRLDDPQLRERRGPLHRRRRRRMPAHDPRTARATCRRTIARTRRGAPRTDPARPHGRGARYHRAGGIQPALRHQGRDPSRGGRRRVLRSARALGARTSWSASRAWTAARSASWPTSRRFWRAASTSIRP